MVKRTKIAQQEDVPVELIQRIQSLLPTKEAARTCILSKSWLHAWSTIPTLSFLPPGRWKLYSPYAHEKYKTLIHRTLQRYHRDNIPIESFHLVSSLNEENHEEWVSLANTWIQQVFSKNCLKEFSLTSGGNASIQNQYTKYGRKYNYDYRLYPIQICSNLVIKCVSLRVLELQDVIITDDVLQNLLSTCSLLEKIKLLCCEGFRNVKIKNLLRLHELDISTKLCPGINNILEINNVPSLRSFCYLSKLRDWWKPIQFQLDSLTSVTQLHIEGVTINDLFFDILKSKFPFLESLTLGFGNWGHENMVISSVSLRWLTLKLLVSSFSISGPFNIQVNAPRLICFKYDGILVPGLTFPTVAPEQIKLTLGLTKPMDCSYFLKMGKALNLLSKFDINIIHDDCALVPVNIDVVDLRKMVSVSVTDVQLSIAPHNRWKDSRFFDAFFSICHPSYIKCAKPAISKLMRGETNDLKAVLVKNPQNGKWEALTSSWESVLKTLSGYYVECKLNWLPQ